MFLFFTARKINVGKFVHKKTMVMIVTDVSGKHQTVTCILVSIVVIDTEVWREVSLVWFVLQEHSVQALKQSGYIRKMVSA